MADDKKVGIQNLEKGAGAGENVGALSADVTAASADATSMCEPLTKIEPNVGSHLANQLTASLEDIANFLKTIQASASEYFKKEDTDDVASTTAPPGGDQRPPGGGGRRPNTTTAPTTPATDPDKNKGNVSLKALEQISLTELFGLATELIKLSNPSDGTSLDEFLYDDKNADKIKKLILESPNVPDSIKKQIKDLDSKVVRKAIYNMIAGKNPEIFDLVDETNNVNKVALYKYLETVANNNGKTLEQLLNDSTLLKDTMSKLGDVVELIQGWEKQSATTFQEQLKSFYYGDVSNEFPDQDIYATRAYIDYLSTECEIGYDELLNDKEYASTLKEGAQSFGKSLSFFTTTSFFSEKNMKSTIQSALKGVKIKKSEVTENTNTQTTNTTTTSGDGGMENMYVGGTEDSSTDVGSVSSGVEENTSYDLEEESSSNVE